MGDQQPGEQLGEDLVLPRLAGKNDGELLAVVQTDAFGDGEGGADLVIAEFDAIPGFVEEGLGGLGDCIEFDLKVGGLLFGLGQGGITTFL